MISNTLHGDFGSSLKYQGQSVNTILKSALPVSATIGFLAYVLALTVGVTFGALAALRQNSQLDYSSMALAMVGISLPNFVLGPLLVLVLSLTWYVFPPALWGGASHLVLPVLTLSGLYMAYIARLTRSGMLEGAAIELHQDRAGQGPVRVEGDSRGTRCAEDCCRSCPIRGPLSRFCSPAPWWWSAFRVARPG
jgi:ABC-type dipeptide/oligopeptide/nickel transport system permease component